jgi:hypothetical protein
MPFHGMSCESIDSQLIVPHVNVYPVDTANLRRRSGGVSVGKQGSGEGRIHKLPDSPSAIRWRMEREFWRARIAVGDMDRLDKEFPQWGSNYMLPFPDDYKPSRTITSRQSQKRPPTEVAFGIDFGSPIA